jgi:hypothetical protein
VTNHVIAESHENNNNIDASRVRLKTSICQVAVLFAKCLMCPQ